MRFVIPALCLAALASPVVAQPGFESVTVRISLGDADLSRAADRAALEQRIEQQITKACTIESKTRYSLGQDVVDMTCVTDARAKAQAQIERVVANEGRCGGAVSAN